MHFSGKLKTKRKEFKMSQEQLAEKIGVSRQAITKWETDAGMPDIENLLAIASLFGTTVDELLSAERQLKNSAGFFHESTVEYDISARKHYDINIGGAYEVVIGANPGEKLRVRLASNAIASLAQLFKVRIDDGKDTVDVDIHRGDELSRSQAKDALHVFISVPAKYTAGIELSAHAHSLRLSGVETEIVEVDGKVSRVRLTGVKSVVELGCSSDMTVVCDDLCGDIGFYQVSATSLIHIPKGTAHLAKKKGVTNRISHTLDGKDAPPPAYPDAQHTIRLSGLHAELTINECSDIEREAL